MADKKIYVDHSFQQGAKIKLNNEGSVPTNADEGGVVYSDGLYVSDDTDWNEVATDTNTITLTNKTIDAGDA
tara:strand:- start:1249 stop:1464 length:216 start_codon:yes stop_codon:yes gene_type:complete